MPPDDEAHFIGLERSKADDAMSQDRLHYIPDRNGTLIITITRSPGVEGSSPQQVVARIYDRKYALVMAKSPELLGVLKWLRTLLAQEACQCQPGVKAWVLCTTDDLLAEIDQGAAP